MDKVVNKVIRNGQVAVLYSPGYGAGWSTWAHNKNEAWLFHPEIVAWVEAGKPDPKPDFATLLNDDGYFGGAEDLTIEWLPVGTQFRVSEYDGNESIITVEYDDWFVA